MRLCLVVVSLFVAELPDAEWRAARSDAMKLMKKPGLLDRKEALIARVARDDSARVADLFKRWSAAAREERIHEALGRAIGGLSDREAIRYLTRVRKGLKPRPVRLGLLRCLTRELRADFLEETLSFADDEDLPRGRLHLLRWIAERNLKQGLDASIRCLDAGEVLIRRTAVATLWKLNRPRAVKPLIDAMQTARGQLLDEIEQVLRFFTGRSFDGIASAWQQWWRAEGQAWLQSNSRTRYPKKDRRERRTTAFYGLPTRSERIIFVLDRSGSMKAATRDGTWFQVMQNQFVRALKALPGKARFGVVFYGSDIVVWKEPPALVAATAENKRAAEAWVRATKPRGSTRLFEGLAKALEYAESLSGADTIYLLSDGSPDHGEGRLTDWEVNQEYKKFLAANRTYRCVVHCIGIGPNHNRDLMGRIARDSGGGYKAVAR